MILKCFIGDNSCLHTGFKYLVSELSNDEVVVHLRDGLLFGKYLKADDFRELSDAECCDVFKAGDRAIEALKHPFIDTETTGLDKAAQIVEVGIVFNDRPPYQQYFRPSVRIHPQASAVNGLTNEDLKNFKALSRHALNEIFDASPTFVAYNAQFDRRMFRQEVTRLGLHRKSWPQFLCAKEIWTLFHGSVTGLEAACSSVGIEAGQHRAVADACAARELMQMVALMAEYTVQLPG